MLGKLGLVSSVLILSTAPVFAQEAMLLEGAALFPLDGATGVPTNTSFLVEYRGVLFAQPESPLELALVVTSADGEVSGATEIIAQPLTFEGDERRYGRASGSAVTTSDLDGFELQSGRFALAPNTRYRLQSSVAGYLEERVRLVAVGGEYRTLAEFETGSGPDEEPPVARWTGAREGSGCSWEVELEAEDDQTPAGAVRYVQMDAFGRETEPRLGPRVTLSSIAADPDGSAEMTAQVVPIDLSGNRGDVVGIPLPSCERLQLSTLGCDVGPECEARDTGCALAATPGARGGAALIALGTIALLLRGRLRRRMLPPNDLLQTRLHESSRARCGGEARGPSAQRASRAPIAVAR